MLFRDIIDQVTAKAQLIKSVENKRIPHAQIFVAPKGSGALPLAIAYAQYILCQNSEGENITGNEPVFKLELHEFPFVVFFLLNLSFYIGLTISNLTLFLVKRPIFFELHQLWGNQSKSSLVLHNLIR